MQLQKVTNLNYDQFIGRKIFKRRKQLKLTQMEVAKVMGITFQQVQKYEKGVNIISTKKLRSLSAALKIPKIKIGFCVYKYNKKIGGSYE